MDLIQQAIQTLKSGGVIAYSTDTIPGLGCDATNEIAIDRIFEIKNRPVNKSVIVLVSSDAMLQKYVEEVPEVAWDILDFSTKPTTIIYPKGKLLAKNAIADDGSIGIRMIKEGPLQQLIHKLNRPLVSTSANLSGEVSPKTILEISPEVTSKVDLVVDLPTNKTHTASAIIKIEVNGEFKIIRK